MRQSTHKLGHIQCKLPNPREGCNRIPAAGPAVKPAHVRGYSIRRARRGRSLPAVQPVGCRWVGCPDNAVDGYGRRLCNSRSRQPRQAWFSNGGCATTPFAQLKSGWTFAQAHQDSDFRPVSRFNLREEAGRYAAGNRGCHNDGDQVG